MEFSHESSIILQHLIPKLANETYKDKMINVEITNILYNDLKSSMNYYNKTSNNIKIKLLNYKNLIYPTSYSSNYYSREIKDYIQSHIKYQLEYTFNIYNRKFTIFFSLFNDDEINNIDKYNNYIKYIIMWLHMCNKYTTHKCSRTLKVFFYLTPLKKTLPHIKTKVISYEHINTGMTYRCVPDNEIFIYRTQEWFKVFIHETFHSFGLDIDNVDNNILKDKISKIFPIHSSFNISETYTEVWARILNCCFSSFLSSKNETDFNLFFNFTLQIERIFSIIQLNKILAFMNLEYNDLWGKNKISEGLRNTLYKEDSNTFCYFVLAGILMNDYTHFLKWCYENNSSFIKYKQVSNNIKFVNLILELYKNKNLSKNNENVNLQIKKDKHHKFLSHTSRMSAIEIKMIE